MIEPGLYGLVVCEDNRSIVCSVLYCRLLSVFVGSLAGGSVESKVNYGVGEMLSPAAPEGRSNGRVSGIGGTARCAPGLGQQRVQRVW